MSKLSQVERHEKLGRFLLTAHSGKVPGNTVGRLSYRRTLILRDFKVSAPAIYPNFSCPLLFCFFISWIA